MTEPEPPSAGRSGRGQLERITVYEKSLPRATIRNRLEILNAFDFRMLRSSRARGEDASWDDEIR